MYMDLMSEHANKEEENNQQDSLSGYKKCSYPILTTA